MNSSDDTLIAWFLVQNCASDKAGPEVHPVIATMHSSPKTTRVAILASCGMGEDSQGHRRGTLHGQEGKTLF